MVKGIIFVLEQKSEIMYVGLKLIQFIKLNKDEKDDTKIITHLSNNRVI